VLIIRTSKLYYTASGIIPVGGRPVHRLREDSSGDFDHQGQLNII